MVSVTRQAFLNTPIAQVWRAVADPTCTAWRSDLTEVECVDEGKFIERTAAGEEIFCTVTASVPHTDYAVHRRCDGIGGNRAFLCKDVAGGTVLTVAASVDRSGLAALGAKAALKKQLRTLLRDLERFLTVSAAHNIIVDAEVEAGEEMEALIRRSIAAALSAEGVATPCEINVLLTDDEGIHRTNLEMRDVDRPTDVLSFPMFDLVPPEKPGEECVDVATGLVPLGDMCISLERAAAQAEEFGHSVEREVSYLTVHSVLHLLGYDHMDEGEEKARMRAREDAVMAALGIGR